MSPRNKECAVMLQHLLEPSDAIKYHHLQTIAHGCQPFFRMGCKRSGKPFTLFCVSCVDTHRKSSAGQHREKREWKERTDELITDAHLWFRFVFFFMSTNISFPRKKFGKSWQSGRERKSFQFAFEQTERHVFVSIVICQRTVLG